MLFRDYLYMDEDRINRYYKSLGGKIPKLDKETIHKTVELEGKVGFRDKAKANGSHTKEIVTEIENEYTIEDTLRDFEDNLSSYDKEVFFDLTDEDIDINTIPKGAIIKFESKLLIPYEFEEIDFIKSVISNPIMSNSFLMDIVKNDESEKDLFKSLMKEGRNIPIYFDLEECNLYSNIPSNYLNINYDLFEEYIDEEVTVIAKIEKNEIKKEIKVYDKYTDLFKLNRAMRRNIDGDDGNIFINGPGKKISILAIYV